jgi:hypothetical protein
VSVSMGNKGYRIYGKGALSILLSSCVAGGQRGADEI